MLNLTNKKSKERVLNMLASEEVLKKEWDNELDERWNNEVIKGERKMETLFVYDALKKPEIQKKVIGRISESSEDSLKRYKPSQINLKGEIYPILIKSNNPHDFVFGQVLEIFEEELKKIDKYETDSYKRIKVVLSSGKEAWVYVK